MVVTMFTLNVYYSSRNREVAIMFLNFYYKIMGPRSESKSKSRSKSD